MDGSIDNERGSKMKDKHRVSLQYRGTEYLAIFGMNENGERSGGMVLGKVRPKSVGGRQTMKAHFREVKGFRRRAEVLDQAMLVIRGEARAFPQSAASTAPAEPARQQQSLLPLVDARMTRAMAQAEGIVRFLEEIEKQILWINAKSFPMRNGGLPDDPEDRAAMLEKILVDIVGNWAIPVATRIREVLNQIEGGDGK